MGKPATKKRNEPTGRERVRVLKDLTRDAKRVGAPRVIKAHRVKKHAAARGDFPPQAPDETASAVATLHAGDIDLAGQTLPEIARSRIEAIKVLAAKLSTLDTRGAVKHVPEELAAAQETLKEIAGHLKVATAAVLLAPVVDGFLRGVDPNQAVLPFKKGKGAKADDGPVDEAAGRFVDGDGDPPPVTFAAAKATVNVTTIRQDAKPDEDCPRCGQGKLRDRASKDLSCIEAQECEACGASWFYAPPKAMRA